MHDALAPHLLDCEFLIDDLATTSDADLLARPMSAIGRLALIALKSGRSTRDLAQYVARHVAALRAELRGAPSLAALVQLVRYVLEVGDGDPAKVTATIANALPTPQRSHVMTTAQILIERGRLQGKAEGKAEGIVAGRRAGLIELLEARFGRVSSTGRARIRVATLGRIRVWQRRALAAPDERAVFGAGS
jgi:hypothetical protein